MMKRRTGAEKLNRHAVLAVMKHAIEELLRGEVGWRAVEENERIMRRAQKVLRAAPQDEKIITLWYDVRRCWQEADERATPLGFWEDFERLKQRDGAGLESGIAFLEADPHFFRSGYIKEWLTTFIRRLPLSKAQEERLRRVALHVVDTRDGREFRYFCRLARRIADDELRRALQERLLDNDQDVRRRAAWMLAYCAD